MKTIILEVCQKELTLFPREVVEDFLDIVSRLNEGLTLNMPLSRAMPSIGRNVHELRLKDKSGIYRVFYFIKKKEAIYIVHAFKKKTQKTPKKSIELVKKRIRRLL
ncbi:MAG: type II toxin-antitoxin system RelE/ParE family toxin [Bacteriovoracales bacterium]|nr:type II toxin-antitoxin system RelE/ParE family toxin [Bacteriovoracales bacterium]